MDYIKLIFGIGLTITLTWMLSRNSILATYFSQWRNSVGRQMNKDK